MDDSISYRVPCVELLEKVCGFQCDRQFGSAEELLAALGEGNAPDAILLDVGLPGMSGVQALSSIKTFSPATVVIICSSLMNPALEREACVYGARGVYAKGEPIEDLARIVRSAVQATNRVGLALNLTAAARF